MSGIQFDWVVNLGAVVNLSIYVMTLLALFFRMRYQLDSLEEKIEHVIGDNKEQFSDVKLNIKSVEHNMTRLTEILVVIGRQEERLNAFDRRLSDLRNILDKRS